MRQVREEEAGDHLAEGFASSKMEAIDQALAVAGATARWLAAGYARRYYANNVQSQASAAVAQQEFLYYDMRTRLHSDQRGWRSLPYRIVKRTAKYVYVASTPYVAERQAGHWVDVVSRSIRLERASLEQWGYAFVSFGDAERYGLEEPLFYTTPYTMRTGDALTQQDCFEQLGLTPPYTVAAVKSAYRRLAKQHHPDRGGAADRFLTLQIAYRQAIECLTS
jgi:hypothetical protein